VLSGLIYETGGKKHVYTIEDPPEYRIPGAIQTPITNAQTDEARALAFTSAIAGAMRLDPDVIMLGEVRDSPTALSAFEASRTGHQVWTTTHSINAFAAITRVKELKVPLSDLASPDVFSGSVAQRLLNVLCECKVPIREAKNLPRLQGDEYFSDDFSRIADLFQGDLDGICVTGMGCPKCKGTGHLKRTAVAEVVVNDKDLLALILADKEDEARDYWRERQKGLSMLDHAIMKIKNGLCDPFQAEGEVGMLDEGRSTFTYKERKALYSDD
jgi:type II secretory ATPase GspE/PulE/Tfp pilus assembly ATPase PilB-like protein